MPAPTPYRGRRPLLRQRSTPDAGPTPVSRPEAAAMRVRWWRGGRLARVPQHWPAYSAGLSICRWPCQY